MPETREREFEAPRDARLIGAADSLIICTGVMLGYDQYNDQQEHGMAAINLAEAKAHLSELVSKAENGEETVIMRRGEAVARLIPINVPKQKFRSLADFRATLPKAAKPSVALIRELRDEGY